MALDPRTLRIVLRGSEVPVGEVDLETLAPLTSGLVRALRATARQHRGRPATQRGEPGKVI